MYVLCCSILGSLVIRYIKIALTSGWAIDELTVSRTRSSCLWVYRLVLSVSHIGKYTYVTVYSYRLKPYQTTPVTQRISNGFNCRDTSRGKRGKKAIWSLLRSVYAIMSPIYWLGTSSRTTTVSLGLVVFFCALCTFTPTCWDEVG